jgi:hypothetical protein
MATFKEKNLVEEKQLENILQASPVVSMAFKLVREAEKHWQCIRGYKLIEKLINGGIFIDGIEV